MDVDIITARRCCFERFASFGESSIVADTMRTGLGEEEAYLERAKRYTEVEMNDTYLRIETQCLLS